MGNVLDVFNQDAFGVISLTEAIDKLPYQPKRLGEMNLFDEGNAGNGVRTPVAMIEERHGRLMLLGTEGRGTMPQYNSQRDRVARAFPIPHIPYNDNIIADDLTQIRAFGTENTIQAVSAEVNDRLTQMKMDHETTWEWHRVGAIKGVVVDADGSSTVYDWFNEFGIVQKQIAIDTSNANAIKLGFHETTRHIQDNLGADTYIGIHVMCGKDFMDMICTDDEVKEAYNRWQESALLRTSQARQAFPYAGLLIEEYRGSIGGSPFVDDALGYAFPVGTKNVFRRYDAPGTFIETVGTKGRSVYAKQHRMKFDTGIELHTQSNPLFMCQRPGCLVEITLS